MQKWIKKIRVSHQNNLQLSNGEEDGVAVSENQALEYFLDTRPDKTREYGFKNYIIKPILS